MIDLQPFINISRQRMEPFLDGICQFVELIQDQKERSDYRLLSKPIEEYVRNILGASILAYLQRSAFLKTTRRIVVLPECLKNYGEDSCCKAEEDGVSYCTLCNGECQVFDTVESFADDHTDIVLEPDDLKKFLSDQKVKQGEYGVVGVACALTLLSGFQYTLQLRLPTQGVFLNYASCGHHWAKPGYNTSYSFKRLSWVLGLKRGEERDYNFGPGATYSLLRDKRTPADFYVCLDDICHDFEREYFPLFKAYSKNDDVFELSEEILKILVPKLITRDSV